MPKIYKRYVRRNSKATNSRQLPKAKICQRYAQDMPKNMPMMPKVCQRYTTDMLNIIFKGDSRINEGWRGGWGEWGGGGEYFVSYILKHKQIQYSLKTEKPLVGFV